MGVSEFGAQIRAEVSKAVVGQERALENVLVAILANGHVLLEGVPGVAKTLMIRAISKALDLPFSRVQFTPDLMPSDIIGTNVFDPKTTDFRLHKGPIFTSILLADEINRTPPKSQAALLEAMEERQATIDGVRYPLPEPFLVFATQNPIEFEGTYPLPEAQQDRFLLKVLLEYPPTEVELEVLRRFHAGFRSLKLEEAGIQPVANLESLKAARAEVDQVVIEDKILAYILNIVQATRTSNELFVGASPRAGQALVSCSKATAALRGRNFVIPDDVKGLAPAVLRHRVVLRPEAEIEGLTVDRILHGLIEAQPVPR
ncbi:MAG TPA: MoxR family ATPase [Fimbriimonadaceae bacterium]|nr:MoxR family ATPase [Fimbriimonadaceae bacterium]HRJ33529.1 MoxR family ATPase [Fimbriimonadaceae bacterium]